MPKCVMLEKGITYRPGGTLNPCCMWKWQNNEGPITDYQEFRKIIETKNKQMSESDKWIPECKQCEDDTKFKGDSLRDHANQTVEGGYWEMNFNNTCNLACKMCNGSYSSTWMSIMKSNPNHDWHPDYKNVAYKQHLKYEKIEFYHELPKVRHIKLLGGEPFLMKEVYRMLDYVLESGFSKKINLFVTTNLTQEVNSQWVNYIENFKHVQIMGSVDGLYSRYNYIRPGADFNQVVDNAKKIRDLQQKHNNLLLTISCCGQTLTAVQHHQVYDFWKALGIRHIDIEQVYDPTFMSYKSLHPTLRQKFNLTNVGLDYDEKEWQMLMKQMTILDKIHGTDFRKECSELFDVL